MESLKADLIRCGVAAALSCLVLIVGLKYLNREEEERAAMRRKEIARRLGRSLQTNIYEDVIACDVVNPDDIDVTFETVGGLDLVKQSLYELVILPLQRPNLFAYGKLLSSQKGILLYGPPGTGKTLLAKAIAKESGAVFINLKAATLMSKWFGDAQKLVSAVFTLAYKLQPSIIFIDEADSLLGHRKSTDHEAFTNMKTEFMALWDGFATQQDSRVMVLAATNRPWELDEAILRRLPRAFEIGIPDAKQRASILRVILKDENVQPNLDYEHVAGMCEGYSGSDLTDLCKQAAYFPIKEILQKEKAGELVCLTPRPLQQADFESVLSNSRRTNVVALEYGDRKHSDGSRGGEQHSELTMADFLKFMAALSSSTMQNSSEV